LNIAQKSVLIIPTGMSRADPWTTRIERARTFSVLDSRSQTRNEIVGTSLGAVWTFPIPPFRFVFSCYLDKTWCDTCFETGGQPNNLPDFETGMVILPVSKSPDFENGSIWQAPVLKPELPNGPLTVFQRLTDLGSATFNLLELSAAAKIGIQIVEIINVRPKTLFFDERN